MTEYGVLVQFVAHLYRDHGLRWSDLKRRFPGMGRHFWADVRSAVA